MESDKRSRYRNTSSRIAGDRMSTIERARANEGMRQAMAMGNLTLEALGRARALLKAVRQAVGRGMVPKRNFTKSSATYFD
jgi:hypothetical protein